MQCLSEKVLEVITGSELQLSGLGEDQRKKGTRSILDTVRK